jgi:hypothetical protein
MLMRVLSGTPGMIDYRFGPDDELDAALILSGTHFHEARSGRYCFQTTYLNEHWPEYIEHAQRRETPEAPFKLIWLVRNPASVVTSMVYNWARFARVELFEACGVGVMPSVLQSAYRRKGSGGFTALEQACWGYVGKARQLLALKQALPPDLLYVLEYDRLVSDPAEHLSRICRFTGIPFDPAYGASISRGSVHKAERLATEERAQIEATCGESYRLALECLS